MSTAAAAEATPPPKKGKKKLIIIAGAVLALVLAGGGGAAYFLMKKKPAAEQDADAGEAEAEHASARDKPAKRDPHAVPTFVPLEPFTVNLADREAERYAQVGITLEVDNAKTGEQVKLFMPAIRNNILMALADKTAAELMERDGKTKLAEQVRRETARALGVDVGEADSDESPKADKAGKPAKPKKKKAKQADEPWPVTAVHFSNFIIQ
jgi:flagellar FliL protein